MRASASAFAGIVLATASGCADFVELPLGVCGNRIVDRQEDCDDPDDPACGAAGLESSCRFVCDPLAEDPSCPAGRTCGADGICRAPDGTFVIDPIAVDEEGARRIGVGDLDGDGLADLVLQTTQPDLKVVYFDGAGGFAAIDLIEPIASVFAVGDLTHDGLADVYVAPEPAPVPPADALSGISLWRGDPSRALEANVFATLRTTDETARLLSASLVADRVFELVAPDRTRRWSRAEAEAIDSTALGFGGSELGQAIAVADVDGGTCEGQGGQVVPRREIALAKVGAFAVAIVSTCGAGSEIEARGDVALSGGAAVGDAGGFFSDVDGDARLDLLVQDDTGAVRVAYGAGDASFGSTTPAPVTNADSAFADAPLLETRQAIGRLLGIGDLDGDGSPDLVTTQGLLLDPGACASDCVRAWPRVVEEAALVDFNADGALDVVTLDDDIVSVHLGGSLGPDAFETQQTELVGPLDNLVVGDFDRDTVADVAFVELDEDAPTEADEMVVIAYGGDVADWHYARHGPFVGVQSLVVERASTIVARVVDAQRRPAGAFIERDAVEHHFGVLPRDAVVVRTEQGLAVAAVVTVPGQATEALAHFGFVGGSLSPHDVTMGDALDVAPGRGVFVQAIAADLDADGIDEIVVAGDGTAGGRVWHAALEPTTGRWTTIGAVDVGPGLARRPVDDAHGEPPGGGPGSALAVGDVEGDGDRDVIATTDEPSPRIVVVLSQAGRLDANARLVHVDGLASVAFVVPWHATADGRMTWLLGGPDGVGTAEIDPSLDRITVRRVFDQAVRAMAAADVDADGLLDLAFATDDEVLVHLAHERIGAQ